MRPVAGSFTKERADAPEGFFAAEAAGLRWLEVAGGPRVVRVYDTTATSIALERLAQCPSTVPAAVDFAGALARLHQQQCRWFGEAPPGAPAHGYIGDAVMSYGQYSSFAQMYAEIKLIPYLRIAYDSATLSRPELDALEGLAAEVQDGNVDVGPPIEPRRLHGDLWNGNVCWVAAERKVQACLIDPAAYGGHPETDLAMLALFGFPHWREFSQAYADALPLSDDWSRRVPLHQLYPLLVHVVLFGRGYVPQLVATAEAVRRRS